VADTLVPAAALPVAPQGSRASGWYGLVFLVATEGALFVYLLFSYFFLASQAPGAWPPSGAPPILSAAVNTLILLASSVTAFWAQRGIEKGSTARLIIGLALSLILGAVFAGVQVHDWMHKPFNPATDAYGSLFYTITGVHIAHVAVGLFILACLILWAAMGRFSAERHLHVTVGVLWLVVLMVQLGLHGLTEANQRRLQCLSMFWHFLDLVWVGVFSYVYLVGVLR
jgi:heme/copper-type cytochrome/quinol oxidase subunit 3